MRVVATLLVLALAACGPSAAAKRAQTLVDAGDYEAAAQLAATELEKNPHDGALWRVRIRAALGQHDARAAVDHYAAWVKVRGSDDPTAMRMMAMTTMWQALESPSAQARLAAIEAVERLEIEALADAVAERMGDDEDVVVAAAAVAILHAFPQAPHVATDMLSSDDAAARRIAVAGIGRKEGARAAEDLRALADDPDGLVRRAVIQALAGVKDAGDTELFTRMAGDPDAEVRAAAIRALAQGKRGDQSKLARAALEDAHLGVRLAAIKLLVASKLLTELVPLLTGEDTALAGHAARELAETMPVESMAALDRILGDADWTVRASGLNLATSIVGKNGARERAVIGLRDEDLDVRVAAARLLRDDERAIAVFVEALKDPALRLEAAIDLAIAGDARGLDTLDALVVDADPGVRIQAAMAYGRARAVHPGLIAALADDNPAARIAAAESILDVVPN